MKIKLAKKEDIIQPIGVFSAGKLYYEDDITHAVFFIGMSIQPAKSASSSLREVAKRGGSTCLYKGDSVTLTF